MSVSKNSKKRVAVGLSGGVDSAVSAYLLKKEGYDVVGVYMDCWENSDPGCLPDESKAYAVQNALALDIKFEQIDFIKEYKSKVVDYFYSEYKAGRTPNPDVMCNKEIKFGLFFDWAMKNGFDHVATGHYARVRPSGSHPKGFTLGSHPKGLTLNRGVDVSKDQSYFLYVLGQEHLAKTLFPVGGMKKSEVRKIAEKLNLPSAKRPDSTGICFIGEVDLKEFLQKRIKSERGNVMNLQGEVIGEHDGVWYYTIGQRRGFTVKSYVGKPLYVVGKDVEKNELTVGEKKDVYLGEFIVSDLSWINKVPDFPLKSDVRIRHLGELHKCDAVETPPGSGKLCVSLKKPIFGVAPGQSAVFYKGDVVLGGGIIN